MHGSIHVRNSWGRGQTFIADMCFLSALPQHDTISSEVLCVSKCFALDLSVKHLYSYVADLPSFSPSLLQMKEDRFRKLFAAFGTLTDCCLKFTKDGKFRKFGFIGYKSEDEAQAALNHFNRSFIDTSRVTVS